MAKKESNKSNWKTTDNRFVAFFDILGFKDLVMRKKHSEIYELLRVIAKTRTFLEGATKKELIVEKFEDAEIYIVNFSDSIVLFSKNENENNFKYFLMAVRWLFAKAIQNDIPLKGGIAHGEVSLNKSEQIYFGQPIIDAYLIEEDVNYFGVVAHNSIDKYLKTNAIDLSDKFFNKMFFEMKTPLKFGKIEHTNVNWFTKSYPIRELNNEDAIEYIENSIKSFKSSVSGSPRRYVDNTLDVYNSLKENIKNLL